MRIGIIQSENNNIKIKEKFHELIGKYVCTFFKMPVLYQSKNNAKAVFEEEDVIIEVIKDTNNSLRGKKFDIVYASENISDEIIHSITEVSLKNKVYLL